jgi:IclR family transcriptional regulator, KDG regulon repressor
MAPESETLSTLDKGLAVLTAFSARRPEWGVAELAAHLNMHKTTVHKVLATYQRWGLIEQDRNTRRYRLGLRLIELAQAVSPVQGLRDAARPELERLVALSGETAKLSVPDRLDSFVIDAVESHDQLRMTGQTGMRNLLYGGASNKVLLAFMPRETAEGIIARTAPGDHVARREPAAFQAELEAIARAGYALSTSEVERGVTAISAPVRDASGQVIASISIVGPDARLTPERLQALIEPVRSAAAAISRRLGFQP